ncbi:MAG TPA: NYN domain-containing protein [Candidatus Elarobacter sp.]|nr:NYN domain-containing protein [Candidatus Elarobacter sp.]
MIDGSNLIGALYRAELGYPALDPWIAMLRCSDQLSYARFYGAPPPRDPWQKRWHSFVAANRHVVGLDFFEGYRHATTGEEKAIDAALVTDLMYGIIANHFDRVVVMGGDGDYAYALKLASGLTDVSVHVLGPIPKGLTYARLRVTRVIPEELVERGICDSRTGRAVPVAHRAPREAKPAVILRGSSAVPNRHARRS